MTSHSPDIVVGKSLTVPPPRGRDSETAPIASAARWDGGWDSAETISARDYGIQCLKRLSQWDGGWDSGETTLEAPCLKTLIPVSYQPVQWSVRDWQAYRDERAGIRQYDGGMSKVEAEHGAFLDCVAMWLRRHPPLPESVTWWQSNREVFRLCRIRDAILVLGRLGLIDP